MRFVPSYLIGLHSRQNFTAAQDTANKNTTVGSIKYTLIALHDHN